MFNMAIVWFRSYICSCTVVIGLPRPVGGVLSISVMILLADTKA